MGCKVNCLRNNIALQLGFNRNIMGCKVNCLRNNIALQLGFNRNIMGCKDVKVEYIRVSRQEI